MNPAPLTNRVKGKITGSNLHFRFRVAEDENQDMVGLVSLSQLEPGETDRPSLSLLRHSFPRHLQHGSARGIYCQTRKVKRASTRHITISFICLSLLVMFIPARAFTWGVATHAYFAKKLGTNYGVLNLQEIYGATLPDMFNLMYGSPYMDYLWNQTHYDFIKVLDNANGRELTAFALGFVSHNDSWGADYIAHHDGRITEEGYVISKRDLLVPDLVPELEKILAAAGVPIAGRLAEIFAPALVDNLIETAVDLLIKQNEDPEVGLGIFLSAQFRDSRLPSLLVAAYAKDFAEKFDLSIKEATEIIIGAEKEYQDLMKFYGKIFIEEKSETIELLAVHGATLAKTILKETIGHDVTVPSGVLVDFLRVAIAYVENDYGEEVSATIAYLEEELAKRGISAGLKARVEGRTVYIQWQASSEADIDHYNIYVGYDSKNYNMEGSPFNVGKITSLTVPDVPEGTYYLALSAVDNAGQESSISEEIKVVVGTKPTITIASNQSSYSPGDTFSLLVSIDNPTSTTQVVDVFLGIIAPDGSIFFFDSSLFNLIPARSDDPRTFTAAITSLQLDPGYNIPLTPFFSVTLPTDLPEGTYKAFAAFTEPGSVQSGSIKIIGDPSIISFTYSP